MACRNEQRFIAEALASLASQDVEERWEAIIADGMSDDGTRDAVLELASRDARFRLVDNPGRFVSAGLNAAIREARGDIIIRVDAHTRYAGDYIRCSVAALRETGADNVGGPACTIAGPYLAVAIAAAYHSPFSCGGARFHNPAYEGPADTVPYGCWLKSTLYRIGLFDEQFVRNQDDELNLRILRSGGVIWQTPKIRSWYRPRADLVSLFRQYFQYGFWKVAVIRKHHLPASWRHLVPGLFVLGNILLTLIAVAALIFVPGSLAALTAGIMLLSSIGLYGLAASGAAVTTAFHSGWRLLPVLPLVFATYHFSYGLGFLAGVLWWPVQAKGRLAPGSRFTRLSH